MIRACSSLFTKQPDSRLVQIKRICGQQHKCDSKLQFALLSIKQIVGKGGNNAFQHFLILAQCFQRVSFSGSLTVGIVW